MDIASFWLPIVGGILLGGFSGTAFYGGHKIAGLWFGFAGVVCFLLLATLQIQRAISDQSPESSDRPHVGVDNIEMIPLQAGRNIDVDLKIRNSGPTTATNVRITVVCAIRAKEPIPAIPIEQTGAPAVLISGAVAAIKCFENSPVLSQENINALDERRMTLWIVGRIDYLGPPNRTGYFTTFRFQHVPGGVRWAIVGDDNQAT